VTFALHRLAKVLRGQVVVSSTEDGHDGALSIAAAGGKTVTAVVTKPSDITRAYEVGAGAMARATVEADIRECLGFVRGTAFN